MIVRNHEGTYLLISGRIYHERGGYRYRVGSFCLDDAEQGPVIELPIFEVMEAVNLC